MLKAKNLLLQYQRNKNRSKLLLSEKERVDKLTLIKVTYYGDDKELGEKRTLEDRYWSLIERKREIEFELDILEIDIKKIEDALKMVSSIHEEGCKMMIMRHLNGKSNDYIQREMNYSFSSIKTKIINAETELESILNPMV